MTHGVPGAETEKSGLIKVQEWFRVAGIRMFGWLELCRMARAGERVTKSIVGAAKDERYRQGSGGT